MKRQESILRTIFSAIIKVLFLVLLRYLLFIKLFYYLGHIDNDSEMLRNSTHIQRKISQN